MRIKFTVDISDDELKVIARHLGKAWVGDDDVRRFLNQAVQDAIQNASSEHESEL
jgi:hypothetical protein